MYDSDFELYKFIKLDIAVQNTILKKLEEQKDFEVNKHNINKLHNEVAICRINHFIENSIKDTIKKPAKKKVVKKVVKEVVESSESEQEIFDLEL